MASPEEISNQCDVITAMSLIASCTRYLESITHSVALAASQLFCLPCVLYSYPTEPLQVYNVFCRDKGKQKVALEGNGTLCQLTPLDRFSSNALLPDILGKLWAWANDDWITTVGSPRTRSLSMCTLVAGFLYHQ
jgi:hypothetical protein